MECFVHRIKGFGLDPVGNEEPLKVLGGEYDMIRSVVQKDGFGKAVLFMAVPSVPRTEVGT